MSPNEKLARRIIGSLALGVLVALANLALDVLFSRRDGAHATIALNDMIIGAAAALLGYIWVSRRDAKHAQELLTERRMEEAIHEERKRIALEIHDTVGQAHAGAIMHMELAGSFLGANAAASEHVHRALQLVCGSMTEMRCALWDLYPEELEKLDLRSALECLVKDLTASKGPAIHLSTDGLTRRIPMEVVKALLRICQEAVSNSVKHSKAHEVRIDLRFDSRVARLRVEDDGDGFQPEEYSESFGLISMRNRAQSLGGMWAIHSEPGRGTDVHASIPIPPMAD